MDLEIRHLRLVAEISDAGSMTRAAARLFLTQSALSHQLRDIEARFDTPFFVRVGRKMVLTAAGRRVLETARRVLGDIQIVEADIRRLAGHSDGSIRVCTQCNTGYHWLAPLLTVFQRKHPGVSVHVAADATVASGRGAGRGARRSRDPDRLGAGPPAAAASALHRRDGGDRRQVAPAGRPPLAVGPGPRAGAPAPVFQRARGELPAPARCSRPRG